MCELLWRLRRRFTMKPEFYDKSKRANVYNTIFLYKVISLCILVILTVILTVIFVTESDKIKQADDMAHLFIIIVGISIVLFTFSVIFDFYVLKRTVSIGRRLNKMAYLDKLTGLPNRYSCDILIDSFEGPDRLPGAGFILMQINNLTSVNEDSGHTGGNWLISEFSSILEEVSENYGYVGRNGGNEFIMLIENCDSTAADMFLLDLTKRIHGYNEMNVGAPMEISYSRVLNIDEHKEKISELISLGYKKLRKSPQTLS